MKILCKSCSHGNVCKYRRDYEMNVEQLSLNAVTVPFSCELKCPYYSYNMPDVYHCGNELMNESITAQVYGLQNTIVNVDTGEKD